MSDTTQLKVGDSAPMFTLKNQDGKEVSLKDFQDKQDVILVFYPGDMTPGCTIQLCNIRDDWSKFTRLGIAVLGINHADEDSHTTFAEKYKFPFPLLVDTDKKISKKYGAIKKLFLATVIKRTVVGINKKGKIVYYKTGMPKDADILKAFTK